MPKRADKCTRWPPVLAVRSWCVGAWAFRQTRATGRSDTVDQRKGTAAAGAWVRGGRGAAAQTIRTSEKFDPEGKWLIVCTITNDIPFVGDRRVFVGGHVWGGAWEGACGRVCGRVHVGGCTWGGTRGGES
jgi:hypothetical protein